MQEFGAAGQPPGWGQCARLLHGHSPGGAGSSPCTEGEDLFSGFHCVTFDLNKGHSDKVIVTATMFQSIPTVIDSARCGDTEALTKALEDISQSMQDMTDALKLMHGRN